MKLLWFRVLVLYEEIERARSRLMPFDRSLYSYNFRQHACTIIFMCMLILGPQFYFALVNPCSLTRYYFFRHERFYGKLVHSPTSSIPPQRLPSIMPPSPLLHSPSISSVLRILSTLHPSTLPHYSSTHQFSYPPFLPSFPYIHSTNTPSVRPSV